VWGGDRRHDIGPDIERTMHSASDESPDGGQLLVGGRRIPAFVKASRELGHTMSAPVWTADYPRRWRVPPSFTHSTRAHASR